MMYITKILKPSILENWIQNTIPRAEKSKSINETFQSHQPFPKEAVKCRESWTLLINTHGFSSRCGQRYNLYDSGQEI